MSFQKQQCGAKAALGLLVCLMAMSVGQIEGHTCAKLFRDVSDFCTATSGFTLAVAGEYETDLGSFDNAISQIQLMEGCVITIYTEKGHTGLCTTIDEFGCWNMATDLGEPSGCGGHPWPQTAANKAHPIVATATQQRQHPKDVRAAITWDNQISSFKCDCDIKSA